MPTAIFPYDPTPASAMDLFKWFEVLRLGTLKRNFKSGFWFKIYATSPLSGSMIGSLGGEDVKRDATYI